MTRTASIGSFVSPTSFWTPEYIEESAWLEHAPFAFWLVDALRPSTIVELGTYTGFSYLSLCQAIARLGIPAKGFAIDTWAGDEQNGFYGEEVYTELVAYHDPRYVAFSRLVRSTFDDAVAYFEASSVDLLHLDGLHTYEAVRHDFDTWRSKLSPRSVVLFHDTNVRERDFGVHRLWAELSEEHPGFEFVHGHGLGVLGLGRDLPFRVRQLLETKTSSPLATEIRHVYARLGAAVRLQYELREAHRLAKHERTAIDSGLEAGRAEIAGLEEKLEAGHAELAGLDEKLAAREEHVVRLEQKLATLDATLRTVDSASRDEELAAQTNHVTAQQVRTEELERLLSVVLSSESWRVTAPLRLIGRWVRQPTDRLRGIRRPSNAIIVDSSGRSARVFLVRLAKHLMPASTRRYLRRRFPRAVGLALNPATIRWRTPSVEELIAQELPLLRPLSVFPVPTDGRTRLTLVTDSLSAGSLFGGVGTSIILAALLARRFDASLRVVTRREPPEPSSVATVLRAHEIPWDENIEFVYSPLDSTARGIATRPKDVYLTTSWWSTWGALSAIDPSRIVYLLQEDERLFYPAGDEQVKCSEVLADDRISFVINTTMLREYFVREGFENIREKGIAFEPAFPESIYFRGARLESGRRSFFFYARPNNVRNLFLRGLEAVRAAMIADILHPEEWKLHFVGKDIPEVLLPYGVIPQRSENLPWQEYAALIRSVDVGLSLMSSPHPSYPPLDLAACGAVAVTNRFGPKQDLDAYSANIICTELSTEALADGIARAVRLAGDEGQRRSNQEAEGLSRSWSTSFEKVIDELTGAL